MAHRQTEQSARRAAGKRNSDHAALGRRGKRKKGEADEDNAELHTQG